MGEHIIPITILFVKKIILAPVEVKNCYNLVGNYLLFFLNNIYE